MMCHRSECSAFLIRKDQIAQLRNNNFSISLYGKVELSVNFSILPNKECTLSTKYD